MNDSPQGARAPFLDSRTLNPTVVLILTAAIFLPALTYGFVCDDAQQIVMNQARFGWRLIPNYFTTDIWSYLLLIKSNYYRPVFMLWLLINYKAVGLNTALWHATALLAHLIATLLVYLLARRITEQRSIATAAALLFGVHPAHVEAVAWISGATETLYTMFGLGAMLCHMRWREAAPRTQRAAWRSVEVALFALALFEKETAIVFPILIFAWEWMYPISPSIGLRKRAAAALSGVVPYLSVLLIYIFARYHALGGFAPQFRNWTAVMVVSTWPLALWYYLRQLLVPVQYSLFYPIAPVRHFGTTEFAGHLLPVLLAIAVLIWIARRSRAAAFSVLLLVLPVLPVLNLAAFPFDDFVHDRYLYLPSAGLCILVAMGLHRLSANVAMRTALLLAAAGVLAFVTIRTSRYWNDDLSLYTRAAEVAPDSAIAADYLSETLIEQDRWADALPLLNKSLLQEPNSYQLYLRIAKCYAGLGEVSEATSYLRDAIAIFPLDPGAYLNLAAMEFNGKMFADAETHMRQALRLRPAYSPLFDGYHYRLARILEAEGKWEEALGEYRTELRENPTSETPAYQQALEGQERMEAKLTLIPRSTKKD